MQYAVYAIHARPTGSKR